MAKFYCTDCELGKQVPEAFAGRKVRCPGCGKVTVVLPSSSGNTSAPDQDSAVFRCPHCEREQSVPASLVGQRARCPHCGGVGKVFQPKDGPAQPDGVPSMEPWESELADDLAEEFAEAEAEPSDRGVPATPSDLASGGGAGRACREDDIAVPWWRAVKNGIALGVSAVLFALALALAPSWGVARPEWFPLVVTMALVAACAGSLVYGLRSRVACATGGADVAAYAGLFVFAQQLTQYSVETFPGGALPTLAAGIVVTTVLVAVFCFFLSRLRYADWVRFVPFPVMGGALAGCGALLLLSAYHVTFGHPWQWELVADWTQLNALLGIVPVWGPPLGLGLVLFLVYRRIHSLWWVVFFGAAATVWCLWGTRYAPTSWNAWLCSDPVLGGSNILVLSRTATFWGGVEWPVLADHSGVLLATAFLAAFVASYKLLRLEEHLGRDVGATSELHGLGLANMVSALAMGVPVSLSLGRSLGHLRSGGGERTAAVVAALVCGAALWQVDALLMHVPRFFCVGVLVFLGGKLLKTWLVDSALEDLQPHEYGSLLLTFLVTVFVGFPQGVVCGALLSLVLGLSRHSASSSIKQVLSGEACRSNVERSPEQDATLRRIGDTILILRLRGYLSGGALSAAMRTLCERMEDPGRTLVRYVVFDFTAIRGIGSGLTRVFSALLRLGQARGMRMVLTNVPFTLEERLEKTGLSDPETQGFQLFRNLDYALEWCEDRLLEEEGRADTDELSLEELLHGVFPDVDALHRLERLLQPREYRSREYVFRQGDAADAMYFVQSGRLTVELESEDGRTLRLRKLGPGTVFGEMGIYTQAPRSASVRSAERAVVYRLSRKRLETLQAKVPELAMVLDRFLVTLLARRVASADMMVRDLMR